MRPPCAAHPLRSSGPPVSVCQVSASTLLHLPPPAALPFLLASFPFPSSHPAAALGGSLGLSASAPEGGAACDLPSLSNPHHLDCLCACKHSLSPESHLLFFTLAEPAAAPGHGKAGAQGRRTGFHLHLAVRAQQGEQRGEQRGAVVVTVTSVQPDGIPLRSKFSGKEIPEAYMEEVRGVPHTPLRLLSTPCLHLCHRPSLHFHLHHTLHPHRRHTAACCLTSRITTPCYQPECQPHPLPVHPSHRL